MALKRIFNLLFPEAFKEKLRKKFNRLFCFTDKLLMYQSYHKKVKKILKNIFFTAEGYKYREDSFLSKIRGEYLKYLLRKNDELQKNEALQECFQYIDKYGVATFCYEDMDRQFYSTTDILWDEEKRLYYATYRGKKVYLKRSIGSVEKAALWMNDIAREQLSQSPHCYLTEQFRPDKGEIVFDIGCAEGNFALEVIDSIEKAYLFECDEEWIEALRATFEPYKDKVCIVPKLVSDIVDEQTITVDKFCEEQHIDEVGLLKMDVEGYEKKVLQGAKQLIRNAAIHKLAVCVYHNHEDEEIIREMLKDNYTFEVSKRYMAWNMDFDINKLSGDVFTHGVLRATVKGK